MNATYAIDFYKADHKSQYPEGTEQVFSNWTPRKSRIEGIDEVVFFGLQYYIMEYIQMKWDDFFIREKNSVVPMYQWDLKQAGFDIDCSHLEQLHDLQYLPLEIWALPEGTSVPIGCPMFVVWNTLPEFFWLTNYIETQISATIWKPCTTATLAKEYRKIFTDGMKRSGGDVGLVNIMGHDFSFRGMSGIEDAAMSGAGHLLSFCGTDTFPAIKFLREYYTPSSFIGGSIPATEHSVMCMGEKESEQETFRRLIQDVYPTGPVSIVSDTWDYWKVLTETIPNLKSLIEDRDGSVILRPDSGDPADIICGTNRELGGKTVQERGTFEELARIFGTDMTKEGYSMLPSFIGVMYGDSITLDRARDIVDRLLHKGFVPYMGFGIGSYTYQMITRDTFGFAMKATAGIVNGEVREIFKDPVTDDGTKKSLKGYVAVHDLKPIDQTTLDDVMNCDFKQVYSNGDLIQEYTLEDIREKVMQ